MRSRVDQSKLLGRSIESSGDGVSEGVDFRRDQNGLYREIPEADLRAEEAAVLRREKVRMPLILDMEAEWEEAAMAKRYDERLQRLTEALYKTLADAPLPRPSCRCQRGCCWICSDVSAEAEAGVPANWARLSADIKWRDGYRCKHCGTRERLTVHHIVPRPQGTHDPRNLVTLCASCHDAIELPPEVPVASRGA